MVTINTVTDTEPAHGDDATEAAATLTPATATAGPEGQREHAHNDAATAVWDALTATPGATVTALAEAAGVTRSTARRTLTTLESTGRAERIEGGRQGGRRAPDIWHPTGPSAAPVSDDADAGNPSNAAPDDEGMNQAAVTEARTCLTTLAAAITTAMQALDGDDRAAALVAAEEIYAGSGRSRRAIRTAAGRRPRNASGSARSHPGELRAKVSGHLAAYPGKEFTPHEVAKAIGHSAGAVANALDRLTALGVAAETCNRPRRFTAVSQAATAPGTA